MKKRRKITSNLDEKIHLGYKDSSEGNVAVECDQVTCTHTTERPTTEALHCYQEVPPSPDQRKLLSSLQYNKNLLKYLNDDRQKQPSFCDLLIIVEGKEFSAHKVVVAVGSSYFHACLSKNPSTDVVTLDHVTHSVFHLLEFLYTSEFFVYKYEIPLVLEAAKFLDIIDAVKLLNNENVAAFQSELTEKSSPEGTVNELTGRLSNNHQCKFCSRHFCYKKSLENHLAKTHRSLLLGKKHGLKMLERSFSARRSKRNRKCPVKFDDTSDDEQESGDGSDNLNQESFDKEKSDKNDSEDPGSEYNAEEDELEEEMSDEYSDIEEQSEKDNDAEEEPEAGDSVGSIHEGLTPVVIQNSNKKILQCPKCDKTFDRIGKYESHTRVHTGEKHFECDICHQRYSTKSNLTVHRNKHSNETEFHKKEHKCPYCNKLHASKKTLAKHVKRQYSENAQEFISIKKTKSESWKCDICKKSFTRRPHLEEHMILHSQDKPFKCTYCEEHFKSRFARLKHQEKFHLVVWRLQEMQGWPREDPWKDPSQFLEDNLQGSVSDSEPGTHPANSLENDRAGSEHQGADIKLCRTPTFPLVSQAQPADGHRPNLDTSWLDGHHDSSGEDQIKSKTPRLEVKEELNTGGEEYRDLNTFPLSSQVSEERVLLLQLVSGLHCPPIEAFWEVILNHVLKGPSPLLSVQIHVCSQTVFSTGDIGLQSHAHGSWLSCSWWYGHRTPPESRGPTQVRQRLGDLALAPLPWVLRAAQVREGSSCPPRYWPSAGAQEELGVAEALQRGV
ncbi:LOW QUALITY PROTEIN: zinc finger and BTB domain-containing protein 41-like [Callospermophilus lateralis]